MPRPLERRDDGATAVGYGLITGGVAAVVIAALVAFGGTVQGVFTTAAKSIGLAPADEPRMVSTWDTNASLCPGTTILLPIGGEVTGTIDWGDGTTTDAVENATHTYSDDGVYTVTVEGTFESFSHPMTRDTAPCLIHVNEWTDTGTTSLKNAFRHARNLQTVAEPPNTVTDMGWMFHEAHQFDDDVSDWDVSNVTTMQATFLAARSFNSDVSAWDTSKVTNMKSMFGNTNVFNNGNDPGVSDDWSTERWDTSKVTNMSGMFWGARSFNADISGWDTSNVARMSDMFRGALNFNQDLSGWNVERVNLAEDFVDSQTNSDWLDEHKPQFKPEALNP